MSIQTTSNLSNAIGTRYTQKYLRAARIRRLYDQLALPVGAPQFDLEHRRGMGSTYTFNFLSDMNPGTTAVSETLDIVPQFLRDATSTITPTSRGEALKWSELVNIEAYTDYVAARAEILGDNAMETIENLAIAAALAGDLVIYGNMTHSTRITLDAGTAGDTWTEANLWSAATALQTLKCPPFIDAKGNRTHVAIGHSDAYYDLFHGGNVISAATYGGLDANTVLLNGELGQLAGFRLVISPWAKTFNAAGAANGTDCGSSYTITGGAKALDKTMTVATGTNVTAGRMLSIGTKETSTTFYETNERVRRVSGTTTLAFVGSGANGGLRFDHAATDYVANNDTVYPVAYGGNGSLVKVYADEVGEFGEIVGPLEDGLAHQWQSLAWKFYGNYGRVAENYIMRGEYSSSLDA